LFSLANVLYFIFTSAHWFVHTPNGQQCAVSETLTIIINNSITIISNARLMVFGKKSLPRLASIEYSF